MSKRAIAVGASLVALALVLPAAAQASPLRFCPVGSGAGQCSEQSGVAADFETERLYVADKGNNRIDVFEAGGTFLFAFGWKVDASNPEEKLQSCTTATGCLKGSAGTGDGQFNKPRRVAVDNDPASGSHHDVYVFDSGHLRVQKFDPSGGFLKKNEEAGRFKNEEDLIAVAPSGKVYVGDTPEPNKSRIEIFDAELNPLEEFELAHKELLNVSLAVDSGGDVYAVFNGLSRIFKFHPDGTKFGAPYPLEPGTETIGLAIGAQDQLFAGQSEGRVGNGPFGVGKGTFPAITEYTPAGAYLERYGYGLGFGTTIETFSGLAVLHSGGTGLRHGDALAGLNKGTNRIAYAPMPNPGPVVAPLSLEAPEEGNTKARIAGEIDPEGAKPTEYRFEYVDRHSFETEGGFASPNTKATPEEPVLTDELQKLTVAATAGQLKLTATTATGLGTLTNGSPSVTGVVTPFGAFHVGDAISGPGIPAKTTVAAVGAGTLTLSSNATESGERSLRGTETTGDLAWNGAAATLGAALESLPGVGAGNVSVTGGPGDASGSSPYLIAFQGALADTDLPRLAIAGGTTPLSGGATASTLNDGGLFNLHAAEAQIGCTEPLSEAGHPGETEIEAGNCLVPETEYVFRLVATNPEGSAEGEGEAALGNFTTKAGLEITETWASEPTTEGARLSAKLDALGIPATGHFEYVAEETCEADEEAAGPSHCFDHATQIPDVAHGQSPLDFGSGEASVRSVSLAGLASGRSYRYRIVASDDLLALQGASVPGPAHTLRPFAKPSQSPCANDEFRSGAGALLADCRAYEMVSPLDKNNADIVPFGEFTSGAPAALNVSATSGDKVSYTTGTPFGDTVSAPYSPTYIAQRDAAAREWRSHSIDSPRGEIDVTLLNQLNTEFKLFSADLCEAWQRTVAEPPLGPGGVVGYLNLYRRTDQSCGGAPDYEALTTVEPPDIPAGHYGLLELQGSSADGSVAIYAAPDNLAGGAGGEPAEPASCVSEGELCELRLYEKRPGEEPKFVCLGPSGEGIPGPCEAGSGGGEGSGLEGNEHNAISANGEDIYWTGAGKIYLRVGGTETQAVSEEGEAISGTSSSRFLAASEDGSEAVFLTEKSGVSDLYLYEAGSEETKPIAHKAAGLAGMSEDGSRIYFASSEALTGEEENSAGKKAQAGKPNLYLDEGGAIRFVMTLGSGDFGSTFSPVKLAKPIARMARVSADGATLAFASTAFAPTGYDNTDAASPEECGEGHPKGICDAEVYLYQAQAEGGKGRLVCASCNPSGARPVGINIGRRIQCGCNPLFFAAAEISPWENNQYASRALSANGRRLFFEAADALGPHDTNGVTDVYEWEEANEGTCREGSSTFVPASGGCVDLVSSGKSGRDSTFLDADPSGRNAFFTTLSSLVPQDYGLVDVYDAREGGGLPPPSPPKVPCEGEACQSPPGPPSEAGRASETFSGEETPEAAKGKKKKGHKRKGHAKKKATHKKRAAR